VGCGGAEQEVVLRNREEGRSRAGWCRLLILLCFSPSVLAALARSPHFRRYHAQYLMLTIQRVGMSEYSWQKWMRRTAPPSLSSIPPSSVLTRSLARVSSLRDSYPSLQICTFSHSMLHPVFPLVCLDDLAVLSQKDGGREW
jgi:hypothetical protein